MNLILWRHADAEDGLVDAERKLTGKGVKQAERMAAWLKSRLPDEVLVLASPATRAQQTARALLPDFETVQTLGTSASAREVLKAAGWPGAKGAVIVVGHQPTLGHTAALLLTGKPAEWSVKKGAIWWFVAREREGRTRAVLRAALGPDLI